MEFMFQTFEEYAEIMNIPTTHPSWEAFKIVWNMARTPNSVLNALANQKPKRKK